jgi:hypothetical protein
MTTNKLEINIDKNDNITVSREDFAKILQAAYIDGRLSRYHMDENEDYGTQKIDKLFEMFEQQEYSNRIDNLTQRIADLKQSFEEMRKVLDSLTE